MSAKHSIEDVKQRIYKFSDGKAELISEDYKDIDTPLEIRCQCGKHFTRSYDHLTKPSRLLCSDCLSELNRQDFINRVREKFAEYGFELIGYSYDKGKYRFTVKCLTCGHTEERLWFHFHDR